MYIFGIVTKTEFTLTYIFVQPYLIVSTDLNRVSRFVHTWQDEHYLSDVESIVFTSDTMSQPYQSLLSNCLTASRNRT